MQILQKIKNNFSSSKVTNFARQNLNSIEDQLFTLASTDSALQRAAHRGMKIGTVIDIGASNGSWSKTCMNSFPDAEYILIDANDCHEEALQTFCMENKNSSFLIAAAGSKNGECFFDDTNPFGGVAGNAISGNIKKKVNMISVDETITQLNSKNPFLIKLDTHGFEKSILQGSQKSLINTELIIIESYIHDLQTSESLTFDKLCLLLDGYNFRVADFSEPMWRKKDNSLWQFDLFFYRKDNIVFKSNTYN